jgi:hypothetical protein
MNFNLSINFNIIDKGKVSAIGWRNDIMNAEKLAKHVHNGFAFSVGSIRNPIADNPKPKADDIDFAQLVCVDIDNSDKKVIIPEPNYWSYNRIVNDNFVKNNALLVYTSPSHSKAWNRVRVVFLLDKRIQDKEEYKEICLALINYFGAAADKSINNIDRLFFGSTNCKYDVLDKVLTINTISNMKAKSELLNNFNKEYVNNTYNDEKYTLTDNDVVELLQYIDGDSLDYNEWLKIYAGVLNYCGFDTALRLLENWSPDKEKGTEVKLRSIQNSNSIKSSIASVVFYAKQSGLDYKTFIKDKTKSLNNNYAKSKNSDRWNVNNNNVNNNDNSIDDDNDNDNNNDNTQTKKSKSKEFKQHSPKVLKEYIESHLNDNYNLRYNAVRHCVEFKLIDDEAWNRFTDRDFNQIQCEFMEKDKKVPTTTLRTIVESDFAKSFNPFESYFNNLERVKPKPYHTPDMINDLGQPYSFDDYIEYTARRVPVPEHQSALWLKTFKRWICGAVATAIQFKGNSRNDLCPILSGGQGVGKTTFTRLLTPPALKEYSGQVSIRPNNKDGTLAITEMFIIIMDEIESFDKNEQEHLKAIITTEYVTERLPYARQKEQLRRTASFIGSINRTEFLSDMTGSRRFPTFQVINKIDTYSPIDYDLLYGQIMYELENGFQYWVPFEDIAEIESNNSMFAALNKEEELLAQYVVTSNKNNANAKFQTTTEILLWLEQKANTKLNLRTLGTALKKKYYTEGIATRNGKSVRGYYIEYLTETVSYGTETNKF